MDTVVSVKLIVIINVSTHYLELTAVVHGLCQAKAREGRVNYLGVVEVGD